MKINFDHWWFDAVWFFVLAVLLSGCVRTSVSIRPDGSADASRTAVLYPFEMGSLIYNPTNRQMSVTQYRTDGGQELTADITARVISNLIKGGLIGAN